MNGDHSLLNSWAGAHLALFVEGQSRLSDLVGTDAPAWELSASTGLLSLNGHRLQCALLGSVADGTDTWVWSWADPSLDPSAIAVSRTRSLKDFGKESGLWEFTVSEVGLSGVVDLGMTPGATIALVASPQIMGGAIFIATSSGRKLYIAVTDPKLTMEAPTAFTAPASIQGAAAYGIGNAHDIVTVYASFHQLEAEDVVAGMRLKFEDGSVLQIDLDDSGHIRRMEPVQP